jgi:hypothetical protein
VMSSKHKYLGTVSLKNKSRGQALGC